jgi:hypothetical protein
MKKSFLLIFGFVSDDILINEFGIIIIINIHTDTKLDNSAKSVQFRRVSVDWFCFLDMYAVLLTLVILNKDLSLIL